MAMIEGHYGALLGSAHESLLDRLDAVLGIGWARVRRRNPASLGSIPHRGVAQLAERWSPKRGTGREAAAAQPDSYSRISLQ